MEEKGPPGAPHPLNSQKPKCNGSIILQNALFLHYGPFYHVPPKRPPPQ